MLWMRLAGPLRKSLHSQRKTRKRSNPKTRGREENYARRSDRNARIVRENLPEEAMRRARVADDDDNGNVMPVEWARRNAMQKNGRVETVNSVRVREGEFRPNADDEGRYNHPKRSRTDLYKRLPTGHRMYPVPNIGRQHSSNGDADGHKHEEENQGGE
jgi:hypothetical protein